MKNVLLLSAGRRVELAQSLKKEIRNRDRKAKLFATDLNTDQSAACQVVDNAFTVPRATSSEYVEYIIDLCEANDIGVVIPTIDTELVPLAKHREKFNDLSINVVISNPNLVRSCHDKRLTSTLFEVLGIKSPKIFNKNALRFPCFVKPYDGSSSIGIQRIDNEEQITKSLLADEKMIFMELVSSDFSEFTLDAYFDQNEALRCLVPRKRIEVRAGEVSKGVTRKGTIYQYLLPKIKKLEGARGCITIQLFVRENSDDILGLEINPRFGGGYPLSYVAGANFIGWLLDEYLLGKEIPFFDAWEANLMMLRYDAKILIHNVI